MYVIRSGRVDVVLKHNTLNPIILAELEPGDFFGEMALLGDSSRSATAVARERSELIGFFHPDLLEIINLHPHPSDVDRNLLLRCIEECLDGLRLVAVGGRRCRFGS